jgi:hypothetical protein
MPDSERARILAIISASLIVGLLYGLGGLSLYLRANYLRVTPTASSVQGLTETPRSDQAEMPTPFPTMTATVPACGPLGGPGPTLYPTITPRPGA